MNKILTLFFTALISLGLSSFNPIDKTVDFAIDPPTSLSFADYSIVFYNQINEPNLKFDAFETALNGFLKLQKDQKIDNIKYLSIVDMSLSANEDRFFIIDMDSKKMVHKSKVAHGRNSGGEYAKIFSNKIGSYQSSIGFFKTAETYTGKHGLSLRLDGLEFSNNNARNRAIVIHSADYVSDNFIFKNGRLGRSLGCPALPKKEFSEVITKIKEGSIIYIYYPNESYFKRSILAKNNINQFFEDINIVSLTD
ncbi:MAG: murein L,D-transpeptidase catalytic domain family protein [Bacteroidota bacterium]